MIVYGYSQGAVVATEYKRETGAVGNTYVLVANPNRPNGGILNGSTASTSRSSTCPSTARPDRRGHHLRHRAAVRRVGRLPQIPAESAGYRQRCSGSPSCTASTTRISAAVLDDPTRTDKSVHGNTTYYLVHTDRLPLLMPFEWIVPGPILDIVDAPCVYSSN